MGRPHCMMPDFRSQHCFWSLVMGIDLLDYKVFINIKVACSPNLWGSLAPDHSKQSSIINYLRKVVTLSFIEGTVIYEKMKYPSIHHNSAGKSAKNLMIFNHGYKGASSSKACLTK